MAPLRGIRCYRIRHLFKGCEPIRCLAHKGPDPINPTGLRPGHYVYKHQAAADTTNLTRSHQRGHSTHGCTYDFKFSPIVSVTSGQIRSGDGVRVDGDSGTVTVLSRTQLRGQSVRTQ